MCTKQYHIGGRDIILRPGPMVLLQDPAMELFRTEGELTSDPIVMEAEVADLSFLKQWETSVYTGGYELRHGQGRTFLLVHWMTQRFAYGVFLDELHGTAPLKIYCNTEALSDLRLRPMHVLGSVGMHHRLQQGGSGVLHAAYVEYKGKAILFAAPSQVGKSTQARLWQQFAGAEIINGDRAMVFPVGKQWHAGGYISCGSSAICRNVTRPLAAIVLLEQGKENRLRLATEKERIHSLFAGLETFHWDPADIDLALSLAEKLGKQIPVLHYSCRPDEDAVRTLQEYLEAN
ncbi:MAG: hypothetical protein IKT58_03425 [Oscillospiraceae bacterium]|nr:hypothetical protein [Oscillospiraceae bacterium]